MEEITGVLAVTLIFGGATTVFLAMSPIGRAIADRIRGRPSEQLGLETRALEDQFEALVEEVEVMRGDLTEMQERLDFTERLLARDQVPKLPGSGHVQD